MHGVDLIRARDVNLPPRIRMATTATIVYPACRATHWVGPDYATTDMRLTRRLRIGERVKLELVAESFNLLNRNNQRVLITQDGFQTNSAKFGQISNIIGINHFPAQIPDAIQLFAGHRRIHTASDPVSVDADFLDPK